MRSERERERGKYDSMVSYYSAHTLATLLFTHSNIFRQKRQKGTQRLERGFIFYASLASLHLSCCLLELIKTLWWQGGGGIYLRFHAMLFRASLCFPLSKHECILCGAPSLATPTFTISPSSTSSLWHLSHYSHVWIICGASSSSRTHS